MFQLFSEEKIAMHWRAGGGPLACRGPGGVPVRAWGHSAGALYQIGFPLLGWRWLWPPLVIPAVWIRSRPHWHWYSNAALLLIQSGKKESPAALPSRHPAPRTPALCKGACPILRTGAHPIR